MRKRALVFQFILILVLGLYIVVSTCVKANNSLPPKKIGEPVVILEPVEFETSRITQIVDDGKYMYVLADAYQGYVQVYDLDGQYRYTLSFYSHANGQFQLAVDGSTVHVSDERGNIYLFDDGVFRQYLPEKNVTDEIKKLDFNGFSARYAIRGASVWRVDGEAEICVICRSWIAFLFQSYLIIPAIIIYLAVCRSIGIRLRRSNLLD